MVLQREGLEVWRGRGDRQLMPFASVIDVDLRTAGMRQFRDSPVSTLVVHADQVLPHFPRLLLFRSKPDAIELLSPPLDQAARGGGADTVTSTAGCDFDDCAELKFGPAGNIDTAPDAFEDEVLAWSESLGYARIFTVTCSEGHACKLRPRASLPADAGPIRGSFFADVDKNGAKDVLIDRGDGRIEVAYGDGSGRFSGLVVENALRELDDCGPGSALIAAEDLNGDGALDYVTRRGVFFGGGATFVRRCLERPEEHVALAVLDLDGDGIRDLAVLSTDQLEILRGTPQPVLNPLTPLPLTGGTGMVAGDFDGRGVDDLAVAVEGEDSTEIRVLYGSRSLETELQLKASAEVPLLGARLDAGHLLGARGRPIREDLDGADLASDLVVSTLRAGGEGGITVLTGSGDRTLSAPYFNRSFEALEPTALFTGRFPIRSSGALSPLLALFRRGAPAPAAFPYSITADELRDLPAICTGELEERLDQLSGDERVQVIDIEGDGRDELLVFDASPPFILHRSVTGGSLECASLLELSLPTDEPNDGPSKPQVREARQYKDDKEEPTPRQYLRASGFPSGGFIVSTRQPERSDGRFEVYRPSRPPIAWRTFYPNQPFGVAVELGREHLFLIGSLGLQMLEVAGDSFGVSRQLLDSEVYALGTSITALEAADFNGDGLTDVVMTATRSGGAEDLMLSLRQSDIAQGAE
jgi:hypothetical protein